MVYEMCTDLNILQAGAGMINCVASQGFGLDWTLIALVVLGCIAFAGYIFRLPSILSIGFGFALVFALSLISGGSFYLNALLVLLGFAIMLNIVMGILRGVGDYAQ